MTKKSYQIFAVSTFMILFLAMTAFAQSDIPHQFQGTVTVNGAPAANGVLVVARVDGVDVAGTTTSGGTYGYNPAFFVPDPYRNRQGKTVEFYVSGVKAAEYVFVNGGRTILDLSVTVSQPPSPPGGGGGGGGGGGIPPEPEEPETCTEDWECTDWFECYNGKQSRVCTDLNDCETEENKPAEQQECSVKICDAGEQRCDGDDLVVCSQNEDSWALAKTCEDGCLNGLCQSAAGITGLVINTTTIAGIIIVIIIVGGIAYWKKLR
ncbi:MAG: hypothetical protein JSW41_02275 [Candidatus Aenigmatarchaeota archaeon]|nr:MAG: hypothetical protein JSW41_02275 [Candidatus Aenigmarchaeota archaeon]